MRLRDFEPHATDPLMQRRNQQQLGLANLAHVGAMNEADSEPVYGTNAATPFNVTYTVVRKLMRTGEGLRLRISGKYSTKAGTTPTATVSLMAPGGVQLCSTGPVTLGDGVTDKAWVLRAFLHCRAAGDNGQVVVSLESKFDGQIVDRPAGPAATVNTNDDLPIDVVWTWGTADAANTATLQMLVPEHL